MSGSMLSLRPHRSRPEHSTHRVSGNPGAVHNAYGSGYYVRGMKRKGKIERRDVDDELLLRLLGLLDPDGAVLQERWATIPSLEGVHTTHKLHRLKRDGLVEETHTDGLSVYALTPDGRGYLTRWGLL